ncbi:PDDEXK nuclease domain-containing protein [Rhodocytophaga aerolata]|uniref:PDDEXK nuclease domain-containing protein n=1 Tax=Rhodocytophaga aerolata TaxID=455078 RepID=A0ABT8RKB7_9BACT|nr:PDDEXK nuclease domain-containing protein [Rhodocytophaga aerolata]MDO1451813.1 PDDEXK nuclease domain-containing protein [Rhodocytophaga aerolata]
MNQTTDYLQLLSAVKQQIMSSRIQAVRAVNKEMIKLYLHIGQLIVHKQEQFGWGKSIVEQLAKDLQKEFSGTVGFSSQNLWYMRQFYIEYREDTNLQQLVGEIPWSHNLLLMARVKDKAERIYYIQATSQLGWSRDVLLNQIKAKAYERHLLEPKQTNFDKALPIYLAEQASEAIKSSYNLEFLGINKPVLEKELESRMITHVKELLLELGYGFSFVGSQYKIMLAENEYFIDLLFFHRKLRCLVAIELKTGKFKPEYAGKMNFYLEVLDQTEKLDGENPAIGIILCAEKDNLEVEYALRVSTKPMGVAEYQLTKELPVSLTGKLPTVAELKAELKK